MADEKAKSSTGRASDTRAKAAPPGKAQVDRLIPLVYDEMRRIASNLMRREARGHILDSTALVNEAYERLIRNSKLTAEQRTYFLGAATEAMKRLLIDAARQRDAQKRGGGRRALQLDTRWAGADQPAIDSLCLREAIERLAKLDSVAGEVAYLFFMSGCGKDDIATLVGKSVRTVEGKLSTAKAWLRRELKDDTTGANTVTMPT